VVMSDAPIGDDSNQLTNFCRLASPDWSGLFGMRLSSHSISREGNNGG
jgi:hypothetical protein